MFKKIPVVILSGFLGSGKTTLLARMLDYYAKRRIRPAVIMNEAGDVNLDGQLVNEEVPMREMLSGCICCTIRGDLGMEIRDLIADRSPDLILIEATGVANPMELFDSVTEAALLVPIDLHAMISVADAAHFLHWHRKGSGKTYRLMEDQIRCASTLLLNKADLISPAELEESKRAMEMLNPNAFVHVTVQCEINDEALDRVLHMRELMSFKDAQLDEHRHRSACKHHPHDRYGPEHPHSYEHVMVYTHYFEHPMERSRIETILSELPSSIYRAKGIFTAADTGERMMFQFAYRQLNLFRIKPQGNVQDVAVFMGEQFPKHELKRKLE